MTPAVTMELGEGPAASARPKVVWLGRGGGVEADEPSVSQALGLPAIIGASVLFYVLVGPVVGGIYFLPQLGLGAFLLAHAVGFIPAVMTGLVCGVVIIARIVPWVSWGGRLAHGLVGATFGLLSTVFFLDYPDWVLWSHTVEWYEFWYTFNRDYAELGVAGLLAGGVCGFVFNPWAQQRYSSL